MTFGRHELALEVDQIVGEVDLVDGPGVLDRVLVHPVEDRVTHWTQGQIETGIEDVGRARGRCRLCRFGGFGESLERVVNKSHVEGCFL